ncbi:hypothetical protein O181_010222 [Austropuccinia psidii MF-1]|uniref:Uncharacterized protein n=1 Tax=Austropuccinia psidii MF-1 TaxID=1389203 RepID=A0A9Q3BTA7_9BASI|nr:hypothetical protein [Austropuccinia psidii MF-1]
MGIKIESFSQYQDIQLKKSQRQEFSPRGDVQIKDSITSPSSQRLFSTFDTIIESPESEITLIPVFSSEKFETSISRDIPVSIQELDHGFKEAGMVTSSQLLDRDNELLPSSGEALWPEKTQ